MTAEKTWHKSTTQQSSTGILFYSAALFFWILVWTFSPIWASASHFPRVPWMSEFSSLAHSLFLTINIHPGYLCLSPVPSHIETISGNSKLIVQLRKCSNSTVQSWYGSSVDSIPIPILKQRRFLYRSAHAVASLLCTPSHRHIHKAVPPRFIVSAPPL